MLSQPRRKSRPWLMAFSVVMLFISCYTAFAPTRVEPESWHPPAAPKEEGVYARNDKLSKAQLLAQGKGTGPEAIALDGQGNIVTGYLDGRLVRISPDGSKVEELANTFGRPLGVAFDKKGVLYIADSRRGLLRLENGKLEVLSAEQGGVPFKFTDDLDVGEDGVVYFTDASSKYTFEDHPLDILEHQPNGRLLAWHPDTKKTELLLGGLRFANGVAVAHDGQSVLVNETSDYRVTRVYIAGPKKGSHDVFAENLPGFPDNITYSREKQRYWVALAAPRDSALDMMGPMPFLRKAVGRLPAALQPKAKRVAQVVALDLNGKVIQYLEDESGDSFSPLSSVREGGGFLYLGSFERDAVGKIAAP